MSDTIHIHPGATYRNHFDHLHIDRAYTPDPEWAAEFEARRASARLRKGEVLAALAAVTDPLLRAVINLHARGDGPYTAGDCQGCDQGCSCSTPEWPCSTIVVICEGLGVDMTDMDGHSGLADWGSET